MFVEKTWYSAGWSHELSAKPLQRKILGRELVLFRDSAGKAVALDATCPHRGANLAMGRIVDGEVECPFHGWRFGGDGRCTRIPSQPCTFKIPPRAAVRSYELREQQGFLWIWISSDPIETPPPSYDFFEPSAGMRRVFDVADLANGPFVSAVENAIDNSHPPFIHPGTLAGEPVIVENQSVEIDPDRRGFRAQLDPHSPWKGPSKGDAGLLGLWRRRLGVTELDREKCFFRFDLGGVVYFYDTFTTGHRQVGFVAITPADDTHTWFFGEHSRSFGKNRPLDFAIAKWMRRLNAEDLAHVGHLLSSQTPHGLPDPVSVVADRPALAFRQTYFRALKAEQRVAGPINPAAPADGRLLSLRHAQRSYRTEMESLGRAGSA